VKRPLILSVLGFGILPLTIMGQVSSAPGTPTDAQVGAIIAKIQSMPVSKLDRKLPKTSLQYWLQAQASPDAKIAWAFEDNGHRKPDCVQINVLLRDGRYIFLEIDVGTNSRRPRIYHVSVITTRTQADVSKLHDLQQVLRQTATD